MLQDASLTLSMTALATVALPLGMVVILVVCMQCFRKKPSSGFSDRPAPSATQEKNFGNNSSSSNSINSSSRGHVNTTFSVDMDDTDIDTASSSAVTIEPLPDISAKAKLPPLRPRMGCTERARHDASLKLITVHHPFPRSQIVYLKELGAGWFGKVIESDAEKIATGVARSKVVVKMLKDDASKDEQLLFFEEVAPFRELEHKNVLRLLGQCTEMQPMLMILESAAFGNLKHYLRSHRQQQAALIQKNRLLQFTLDASSGVASLHRHDYLHKDLAARNCLVMGDHTLKIGDYGIAEDLYKEDYFTSGDELLPVRWMAPETLKQDNGSWSSHNYSKESDIWSLGVLMWEIFMMGERPHDMLTDEAVLQGVITDQDIRLTQPDLCMPNMDRLYEVMRFCWLEAEHRTKIDQVHSLLSQIASQAPQEGAAVPKEGIAAFEQKWEHLMPNQRNQSIDSTDDQAASVSSEDSDLLTEALAGPDSLEDLTSVDMLQALPQAPPRSRRKVSAPAVTIPQTLVDDASPEVVAPVVVAQEKVEEPTPAVSAASPRRKAPPPPGAAKKKEVEPKLSSASSEVEFTEFASHADEKTTGDGLNASPGAVDLFSSMDSSVASPPQEREATAVAVAADAADDPFQLSAGDALTKVKDTLDKESSLTGTTTPTKPKPKPRNTSTPIAKDDISASSSSSFSAGESSSAAFLTASSPGNLTDAFATASDSTLITSSNPTSDFSAAFEEQPPSVADSSMSFEILDSTSVPPVSNDFDKSDSNMSDPFGSLTEASKSPEANVAATAGKDDLFGEFTNGNEGNGEVMPDKTSTMSIPSDLAPSSQPDASVSQNDFFSFGDESSASVSQSQSNVEPSLPDSKAQDADPFASFGTDLSSLSSMANASQAADAVQEQAFPSFASEFSSLSSLDTNPTATPQQDTQSNPFTFDQAADAPKAQSDPFAFDQVAEAPQLDAVQSDAFAFDQDAKEPKPEAVQSDLFAFDQVGEATKPEAVQSGLFSFDQAAEATKPDVVQSDLFAFDQVAEAPAPNAVQSDLFAFDQVAEAPKADSSQSNPFAFNQTSELPKSDDAAPAAVQPQESSSDTSGLGDFSFDMLSSVPDVASIGLTGGQAADGGSQQTPDLFGDLSFGTPAPSGNGAEFGQLSGLGSEPSPDGPTASSTQPSMSDLFGLGEQSSQDSAFSSQNVDPASLDSLGSGSNVPEPSGAFSDFDLLSGFSSSSAPPPAPALDQSSSSSPSSFNMEEGGGLLGDLVGGAPEAAAAASSAAAWASSSPAHKVGTGVESGGGASFSSEAESSCGSTTDTDTTSNSDSGRDYVCQEPWGALGLGPGGVMMGADGGGSSPPLASTSPTSSVDSEEMALQIASEIYLSRGVKMARPYEASFLEPIPEDPLPSEESGGAPTPSETSSVDVRFEDVFEWDDFMGEPLVGHDRTSPEPEARQSLGDMQDWSLDVDSESLRSGGSLRSNDRRKENNGSDSASLSSVDTPNARSSVSDSEVNLHELPRTHRSNISDLIANRTKGLTLNTTLTSTPARTQPRGNFYSLYEEDFDLDSDSLSGGSCSPPVPSSSSTSLPHSRPGSGGVSTLHADLLPPLPPPGAVGEGSAATNSTQDEAPVPNGSGGPDKSPDATLLDFTAFESAGSVTTAESTGEATTADGKPQSKAIESSSLLDF